MFVGERGCPVANRKESFQVACLELNQQGFEACQVSWHKDTSFWFGWTRLVTTNVLPARDVQKCVGVRIPFGWL